MQTVNASPYPRQRLLKEAQLRCARRSPFAKRKAPKRHAFSSPFSLLLHLLLFFFLHKPRTSCRVGAESPNLGLFFSFFFFLFFNWAQQFKKKKKKKGPSPEWGFDPTIIFLKRRSSPDYGLKKRAQQFLTQQKFEKEKAQHELGLPVSSCVQKKKKKKQQRTFLDVLYKIIYVNYSAPHFTEARTLGSRRTLCHGAP